MFKLIIINCIKYINKNNYVGVHLFQMGQNEFASPTDARYPVAFINSGNVIGRSFVKSCIFEDSMSSALGAFYTDGLVVENNIFYKTRGSGL